MMPRKIVAIEDFLWYKCGQVVPEEEYRENWKEHVTITGAVDVIVPKPQVVDMPKRSILDLNNDGKVDFEDAKQAGKVLRKIYPSKNKRK